MFCQGVGCRTCFHQQMAPYHCYLILMAFHSCYVSVCTPACVGNASHKVCKRLVISGLVPFSSFESFLSFSFSCHPFRLGPCPDLTLLKLAHLASKTHTTNFRVQALKTNIHTHTLCSNSSTQNGHTIVQVCLHNNMSMLTLNHTNLI